MKITADMNVLVRALVQDDPDQGSPVSGNPRGIGLVKDPQALTAPCPPNGLRPVLLQGV